MNITIKGFEEISIDKTIKLMELTEDYQHNFNSPIIAAIVDGNLRELTYVLDKDC